MRPDPTELTGLDLLEKLLEQQAINPDQAQWLTDNPQHYPPQQVRLRQLAVLTNVFIPELATLDLPRQLDAILNGSFIQLRRLDRYPLLVADVQNQASKDADNRYPIKQPVVRLNDLERCYQRFVQFKAMTGSLLTFNSDILETNLFLLYSARMTSRATQSIDLSEINSFLSTLIDPEHRVFAKADLIRDYGYPPEDIADLELDWL